MDDTVIGGSLTATPGAVVVSGETGVARGGFGGGEGEGGHGAEANNAAPSHPRPPRLAAQSRKRRPHLPLHRRPNLLGRIQLLGVHLRRSRSHRSRHGRACKRCAWPRATSSSTTIGSPICASRKPPGRASASRGTPNHPRSTAAWTSPTTGATSSCSSTTPTRPPRSSKPLSPSGTGLRNASPTPISSTPSTSTSSRSGKTCSTTSTNPSTSACEDLDEDWMTVTYLRDTAQQAGLLTSPISHGRHRLGREETRLRRRRRSPHGDHLQALSLGVAACRQVRHARARNDESPAGRRRAVD